MTEDRDARIERYYNEGAWDLAGWLVDAEDQIKIWTPRIERLRALEAAGVENWSGYDAAMDILYSYEDEPAVGASHQALAAYSQFGSGYRDGLCADKPLAEDDEPADKGETP